MAELVLTGGSATTTPGGITIAPPEAIIQNGHPEEPLFFAFTDSVTATSGYPVLPGESVRLQVSEEQFLYVVARTTVPVRVITYEVP